MSEMSAASEERVFGEAERVMGSNTEALRGMAMLAHAQRRNKDALRIMSFVWGRNSRLLARAVARWPEWFMGVDGQPPRAADPDELLSLFTIAALPVDVAKQVYADMRRYSWRAWQVRQKADEWRDAQKDPKQLRLKVKDARVMEVRTDHADGGVPRHTLLIAWSGDPKPLARWAASNRRVTLALVERKE